MKQEHDLKELINELEVDNTSKIELDIAMKEYRSLNMQRVEYLADHQRPTTKIGRDTYDKKIARMNAGCDEAWERYAELLNSETNVAVIDKHVEKSVNDLIEKAVNDPNYWDISQAQGKTVVEKLGNWNAQVMGQNHSDAFDMHDALMAFRRNRNPNMDEKQTSIDLGKALQEERSVKKMFQPEGMHFSQRVGSDIWAAETLADTEGEFKRLAEIQKSLLEKNGRWPTSAQIEAEEERLTHAKVQTEELVQSNVKVKTR
ncbi:hypothetical protein [Stenotrophomonas acidaminiphila]